MKEQVRKQNQREEMKDRLLLQKADCFSGEIFPPSVSGKSTSTETNYPVRSLLQNTAMVWMK